MIHQVFKLVEKGTYFILN